MSATRGQAKRPYGKEGRTRKPDLDVGALEAFLWDVFGHVPSYERVREGVSTPVYRVRLDNEVLYLRGAEDPGNSLAPEAEVHARLLAAGARVPEVVHLRDHDERLGRSVMIVREIPGRPMNWDPIDEKVLRDVGRDVARIAAIPLAGFGFLRRDVGAALVGEFGSFVEFAFDILFEQWDGLSEMLGRSAAAKLEGLIASTGAIEEAKLAHGDLDGSHIYVHDETYAGIIDFGEIMGAAPHHDLAHFFLHHDDPTLLGALVAGYRDVADSELDAEELRRTAMLIGSRRVAYRLMRYGGVAKSQEAPQWYAKRTAEMLLA
jgi:Ser/Thr protein kinase RdoA (MazF antagonist)